MAEADTTGRALWHACGALVAIVTFFVGIGFLIAACTDDSDPQAKLHQFGIGWACVFTSLVTAVALYRKEL